MKRAARMAVAVPAIGALAWLGVVASRAGTAEAAFYEATAAQASATAGAPDASQQYSAVEEALRQSPSPAGHELLAALEARRPDRPGWVERARGHYVEALRLRPTSPYTWARLAQLEYRVGNTGAGFERLLVTADALGPSEPEVQDVVLDLGLALFDEVGPATRARVQAALERGLARDALRTARIAQKRDRLALVCGRREAAGPAAQTLSQRCDRREATS